METLFRMHHGFEHNSLIAPTPRNHRVSSSAMSFGLRFHRKTLTFALVLAAALPVAAREKEATQYGAGLIVNIPLPEAEVIQVVQEVVGDGIIRGSKEYAKDEYVNGATATTSTPVFPEWTEGGKVFYKVRLKALDPQNFKDTNDMGTLAVRYVVQGQDNGHTVLRLNARFLEDFRHISHASNGSVEGAEYKDIHDRLDAIEVMKSGTADAERAKQEQAARKQVSVAAAAPPASPTQVAPPDPQPASAPAPAEGAINGTVPPVAVPPPSLEQRVHDLRRQVERTVKNPGAPLKSAPFRTASTLQSLPAGEQVLIEILSPYWLGVETHAGQHGWIKREELEQAP